MKAMCADLRQEFFADREKPREPWPRIFPQGPPRAVLPGERPADCKVFRRRSAEISGVKMRAGIPSAVPKNLYPRFARRQAGGSPVDGIQIFPKSSAFCLL